MSKAKPARSANQHKFHNPGIDEWAPLQRLIGYQFDDVGLLQQALTHKSAHKNHNERLEFLGDAILGYLVAEHLYHTFTDAPEGQLTRMRSAIVKGDTLAEIAVEHDLGDYIKLGIGELKSGGKRRASILADVVESIIGAIYLDAGTEACDEFIQRWFGARMALLDPDFHPKDAKTRLQEFLQSRSQGLPIYDVVDVSGKDHSQTFTVSCQTTMLEEAITAQGPSRKRAEQLAAQSTLEKLQS